MTKYHTEAERKAASDASKKRWWERNKEKKRAYGRNYYYKNKAKYKVNRLRRFKKNPKKKAQQLKKLEEWKKNNPEQVRLSNRKRMKERWKNDPNAKIKNKLYLRKWRKTKKGIISAKKSRKKYAPTKRKWTAERKKTDVNFKLGLNLSKRVLAAIKHYRFKKAFKTERLIGCSVEAMRRHLEKKFKKGMTWKNHSKYGWHIDHIRPLSSFDLTDPKQQLIAFNYKNCKPMWWRANIQKSNKIIKNSTLLASPERQKLVEG